MNLQFGAVDEMPNGVATFDYGMRSRRYPGAADQMQHSYTVCSSFFLNIHFFIYIK